MPRSCPQGTWARGFLCAQANTSSGNASCSTSAGLSSSADNLVWPLKCCVRNVVSICSAIAANTDCWWVCISSTLICGLQPGIDGPPRLVVADIPLPTAYNYVNLFVIPLLCCASIRMTRSLPWWSTSTRARSLGISAPGEAGPWPAAQQSTTAPHTSRERLTHTFVSRHLLLLHDNITLLGCSVLQSQLADAMCVG